MIRTRNLRVLIDRGDPGLENLLPMGEYKISKPSHYCDRRLCLTVTSNERSPPNLISELNTHVALGKRIIPDKMFVNRNTGFPRFVVGGDGSSPTIPGRSSNENLPKESLHCEPRSRHRVRDFFAAERKPFGRISADTYGVRKIWPA